MHISMLYKASEYRMSVSVHRFSKRACLRNGQFSNSLGSSGLVFFISNSKVRMYWSIRYRFLR